MTAAAIVAWRDANGKFTSVDQSATSTASVRHGWTSCEVWCGFEAGRCERGHPIGASGVDLLGGDRDRDHVAGRARPRRRSASWLQRVPPWPAGAPAGAARPSRLRSGGVRGDRRGGVGAGFGWRRRCASAPSSTIRSTALYGRSTVVTVTARERPATGARRRTSGVPRHAEAHRRRRCVRPRHGVRAGPRLRRADSRAARRVPGARRAADAARPVGRGAQRHRRTDARRGVAGAARRRIGAPPLRRCRALAAARRPGRDAARAGARRHVDPAAGNRRGVSGRGTDASDGGLGGQRHDRLRRGAAVGPARRAAGGGRAGGAGYWSRSSSWCSRRPACCAPR